MITTDTLRSERARLVKQFSEIEKNLEQHRGAVLQIDKLIADVENATETKDEKPPSNVVEYPLPKS